MIRTLIPIDIEKVKKEYSSLEAGIPWTIFNKGKQASLQYRFGEDPWISSTGKSRGDELNFNILNPYFSGTVFEEIINRFNLRRSRLMWINPDTATLCTQMQQCDYIFQFIQTNKHS